MKASIVRAVPTLQLFAPALPGLDPSIIATIRDREGRLWDARVIDLKPGAAHHVYQPTCWYRFPSEEWNDFLTDPQAWSDYTNTDGVVGICETRMFVRDQATREYYISTEARYPALLGDRVLVEFTPQE